MIGYVVGDPITRTQNSNHFFKRQNRFSFSDIQKSIPDDLRIAVFDGIKSAEEYAAILSNVNNNIDNGNYVEIYPVIQITLKQDAAMENTLIEIYDSTSRKHNFQVFLAGKEDIANIDSYSYSTGIGSQPQRHSVNEPKENSCQCILL